MFLDMYSLSSTHGITNSMLLSRMLFLIALRKHFFFFAFIWTSQWNAHIKMASKWIHVRIFLLNFQGKCVEAIYKLVPTKFKEKCAGGQEKRVG